jgi:hypothetical protein
MTISRAQLLGFRTETYPVATAAAVGRTVRRALTSIALEVSAYRGAVCGTGLGGGEEFASLPALILPAQAVPARAAVNRTSEKALPDFADSVSTGSRADRLVLSRQAVAFRTGVIHRARILIVARGSRQGRVDASGGRVASVLGAIDIVVAVGLGLRNALPILALVADRARVAVGTGPFHRQMEASLRGITTVGGAGTQVRAIQRIPSGRARAVLAIIPERTGIAVVAVAIERHVPAFSGGNAIVGRAGIPIAAPVRYDASHAAPVVVTAQFSLA